jgi:hypothetical protein
MSDSTDPYVLKLCSLFQLFGLTTVIDTIALGALYRTIFGVRPLA